MTGALPILTSSVLAVGTAILSGTLAFGLLFATNYFSVFTPQGSSANLLFAGSSYLTQAELYKLGTITTGVAFLVYLVIGTPWVLFMTR